MHTHFHSGTFFLALFSFLWKCVLLSHTNVNICLLCVCVFFHHLLLVRYLVFFSLIFLAFFKDFPFTFALVFGASKCMERKTWWMCVRVTRGQKKGLLYHICDVWEKENIVVSSHLGQEKVKLQNSQFIFSENQKSPNRFLSNFDLNQVERSSRCRQISETHRQRWQKRKIN